MDNISNLVSGILPFSSLLSPFLIALLGGVGWLYKHERERREAAETQLSKYKHDAYIALINIYFETMKATKRGEKMDNIQLMDKMMDANKELILYGSDSVFRIYQKWIEDARRGIVSFELFGKLIIEIRRDMGHAKTKISTDDVLRNLIMDYDKLKSNGKIK